MSDPAKLTITSGPDRGKVFPLDAELVHIGSGADNEVVLNDPTLIDRQVSIVSRNGRYAIFTPLEQVVEVDGRVLPPECWVWLPPTARIRVSQQTFLQFQNGITDRPPGLRSEKKKRPPLKTAGKKSDHRNGGTKPSRIARFITDRAGDPLVKLGEDGHLPELTLAEGPRRVSAEKKTKQSNPVAVYAAIAFSFCFSLAMLFIDAEPSGGTAAEQGQARQKIREFYGIEGTELQPYQRLLREARLAHSRNDRAAARQAYRQVLDLLNSEDVHRFTGLTGSPESDERLRKLISTLLRE